MFNSGISFFGEEDDQAQHHPDELKKRGMEKFKQRGLKIEIQELNLDKDLLKEQQAKKEEALRRMNNQESSRSNESTAASSSSNAAEQVKNDEVKEPKKEKKKKNKKKKNKGLAEFMEDKNEASAFNKENED